MTEPTILSYARSLRISNPLYEPLVRSWYCHVDELPNGLLTSLACMQTLSAEEQQRYASLRLPADRTAYLAGHNLLRAALSECTGLLPASFAFRYNAFGRPELSSPVPQVNPSDRLRFNLSHSRQVAVCAVTTFGEIGVDVEDLPVLPDTNLALQSILTQEERLAFSGLPPHAHASALLAYWTLKEAYLKAIGVGLTQELSSISFSGLGTLHIRLHQPNLRSVDTEAWHFSSFVLEQGSQAAIAFRPDVGGHAISRALLQKARTIATSETPAISPSAARR